MTPENKVRFSDMDGATASLLASAGYSPDQPPFLTVAIPQYKRRRYLEKNLESLFQQTFANFEILVSDDCSPDDSNEVIPEILQRSGRQFRYYAQPSNLGYDRNVRFCLDNAVGTYVILLGNDDALVRPTTVAEVAEALIALDYPDVAITNYEDFQSGQVSRRSYGTCVFGSGPATALHFFRSFSFVSGILYKTAEAKKHETDKWDTSIYYQIYLACRIIAAGGVMAGLDISVIRDHIRLEGELVPETYRVRYKNAKWSFRWKHTGLDSVARVTTDAILPFIEPSDRSAAITKIWKQLLLITYPFWILEYRGLANWGWGFGIARDLWPRNRLREYDLCLSDRIYLWTLYFLATAAALVMPPKLFMSFRHYLAESIRQKRQRSGRVSDSTTLSPAET